MNYSVDDRMVSCQSDTTTAEYWYDDDGFRIKKVVNGVRTYYIYDEGMLLGEVSLNSSGQVIDERYYIYEPGSYYPLEMVVYESGVWRAYSYHNDHLMTPLRLTDENQELVWSGNYSAFGEVDIAVEDITNNLRFPGQYEDILNNFYFNHFRYYIHTIVRYNKLDPLLFVDIKRYNVFSYILKSFYYQNNHIYNYVKNNPLIRYDFNGLAMTIGVQYIKLNGGNKCLTCKDKAKKNLKDCINFITLYVLPPTEPIEFGCALICSSGPQGCAVCLGVSEFIMFSSYAVCLVEYLMELKKCH